jgi:hypothetical protein
MNYSLWMYKRHKPNKNHRKQVRIALKAQSTAESQLKNIQQGAKERDQRARPPV